jgi:ATP-binding cassette subfamily C protein CydC
MNLRSLVRDELAHDGRLTVSYVATSIGAALSPAVLFAFSAYLLAKSALRPGILTLGVAVGSVRFFALARGASQYGERLLGHRLALRLARRVRVALYRAVARAAPYRVPSAIVGTLSRAATGDIDALSALMLRLAAPLLGVVGASLVGVVVALAFAWQLGASLAVGLALTLGVVPWLTLIAGRRGARRTSAAARDAHAMAIAAAETWAERYGTPVEGALVERLASSLTALARERRRTAVLETLPAGLAALSEALTVAATVAIGAGAIAHHHLQAVELAVVPFLALGLFEAASGVAIAASQLPSELDAARHLARVVALRGREAPQRPASLPDGPLAIEFDAVSFAYPGQSSPIVEELSLRVPPGGRLVLTGTSGVGKTTLLGLVHAAWEPTRGTVRLGGVDTRTLEEATVARHVGLLPQEAWIFEATLAANLRLAQPAATEDELLAALDAVGLSRLLAQLPDGLATLVDHDRLSSGEAQRVGLARLLLTNAATWILDEPTASVDGQTEDELVELLARLARGRTLVVATHAERVVEGLSQGAILLDLDELRHAHGRSATTD